MHESQIEAAFLFRPAGRQPKWGAAKGGAGLQVRMGIQHHPAHEPQGFHHIALPRGVGAINERGGQGLVLA